MQHVSEIFDDLHTRKPRKIRRGIDSSKDLTRRQTQLVEAAVNIQENQPSRDDIAWMAKHLVQVTLPHTDPGNVQHWSRTNGTVKLTITRAVVEETAVSRGNVEVLTERLIGYPYGSIPRLLLYWLTSETLRTKSRVLRLGSSLNQFMYAVGLSPNTGGGKRSNAVRLKDQMRRLFSASITLTSVDPSNPLKFGDMRVASEADLWWDPKKPEQEDLFESWVELGEKFHKAIVVSPVPVDTRALKALNHSPLALDLYAWATFNAYTASLKNRVLSISYRDLHKQLGAEYAETKAFARKLRSALALVKTVYPALDARVEVGGISILPSKTAVPKQLS